MVPEMPKLTTNGIELYYQVFGEGPVIVFAHGVGGNHAIWFHQVCRFRQTHRVVTFDHRGFGMSTDPQRLGRSAYSDDLAALLDHLEVKSCALVAQSMGGGTCVGYASQYPQRVDALVLADTLYGMVLPADVEPIMVKAKAATEDLGQIERVLGTRARESNPSLAELYRQINSFNATDRHSLQGEYAHQLSCSELESLGIPVLFIAGEHDVLFPPEAIRMVQKRVSGSEWVELAGAGHSAFLEQPENFNNHVADFLLRRV